MGGGLYTLIAMEPDVLPRHGDRPAWVHICQKDSTDLLDPQEEWQYLQSSFQDEEPSLDRLKVVRKFLKWGASTSATILQYRNALKNLQELCLELSEIEVPTIREVLPRALRNLTECENAPPGCDPICVHIRWAIRQDMGEVLEIENESFEFPWSEEDFIRYLRQSNSIGMVCEYDERIVGFMLYELHKKWLHPLNFAVHPAFRRRDVGTQMVEKLITKLSKQRRNRIQLAIRETNLRGQLFFRSQGFRAISVLRDYYDDTPEDAYLMQYVYDEEESAKVWNRRSERNRATGGSAA